MSGVPQQKLIPFPLQRSNSLENLFRSRVAVDLVHRGTPPLERRVRPSGEKRPDIFKQAFVKTFDYEYLLLLHRSERLRTLIPHALKVQHEQRLDADIKLLQVTLVAPVRGDDINNKYKNVVKVEKQFRELENKVRDLIVRYDLKRHEQLLSNLKEVEHKLTEEVARLNEELSEKVTHLVEYKDCVGAQDVEEGGGGENCKVSEDCVDILDMRVQLMEAVRNELVSKNVYAKVQLETVREQIKRWEGRCCQEPYSDYELEDLSKSECDVFQELGRPMPLLPPFDLISLEEKDRLLKEAFSDFYSCSHSVLNDRGDRYPRTVLVMAIEHDDLELFKFLHDEIVELEGGWGRLESAPRCPQVFLTKDELEGIIKMDCPKISKYLSELLHVGQEKMMSDAISRIENKRDAEVVELRDVIQSLSAHCRTEKLTAIEDDIDDDNDDSMSGHDELMKSRLCYLESKEKEFESEITRVSQDTHLISQKERVRLAVMACKCKNLEMFKCLVSLKPDLVEGLRDELVERIQKDERQKFLEFTMFYFAPSVSRSEDLFKKSSKALELNSDFKEQRDFQEKIEGRVVLAGGSDKAFSDGLEPVPLEGNHQEIKKRKNELELALRFKMAQVLGYLNKSAEEYERYYNDVFKNDLWYAQKFLDETITQQEHQLEVLRKGSEVALYNPEKHSQVWKGVLESEVAKQLHTDKELAKKESENPLLLMRAIERGDTELALALLNKNVSSSLTPAVIKLGEEVVKEELALITAIRYRNDEVVQCILEKASEKGELKELLRLPERYMSESKRLNPIQAAAIFMPEVLSQLVVMSK